MPMLDSALRYAIQGDPGLHRPIQGVIIGAHGTASLSTTERALLDQVSTQRLDDA